MTFGQVGDVYRINDTGGIFLVIAVDGEYANVIDQDGRRPRRIKVKSLRTSNAKHGYTLIERRVEPA